jgi:hypothetical protein
VVHVDSSRPTSGDCSGGPAHLGRHSLVEIAQVHQPGEAGRWWTAAQPLARSTTAVLRSTRRTGGRGGRSGNPSRTCRSGRARTCHVFRSSGTGHTSDRPVLGQGQHPATRQMRTS